MSLPKELEERMKSFDAGYVSGTKDAYLLLNEVKKHLEALIEAAVRRGEYEALVYARQILRRLK